MAIRLNAERLARMVSLLIVTEPSTSATVRHIGFVGSVPIESLSRPAETKRSVVQRPEIKKALPVKVGLFASFDNAAGQRHFARGPTLKTAQATGCGGSIAELRAVLQSLTQTFSNQGEPKRPTVGRGISGFSTRKTPDSPGQCVPLAKPVRSFAPTPITKCTGRASGTLFQRAVNNQFRVRWWARQKD